jgi:CheY-like chemotaxis protein
MPQPPLTLRVVIADDERPARRLLAMTLQTIPGVVLVGEASGGVEAVAMIERERPDLALLDIEMPEVDGLSVVRSVPAVDRVRDGLRRICRRSAQSEPDRFPAQASGARAPQEDDRARAGTRH